MSEPDDTAPPRPVPTGTLDRPRERRPGSGAPALPRGSATPVPKRWLTQGGAPERPTQPPPTKRAPTPAPVLVRRPRGVRSPDALTYIVRAMVYEVWVVALTGLAVSLLLFVGLGSGITDVYLQTRGVGPVSGHVAQVTIGEEALYLWDPTVPEPDVTPRALLAEIVRFLDRAGADVIVLDVLLDRPEPGDAELAAAAKAHGAVVAAERYVLTEPATDLQFQAGVNPAYAGSLAGGFANLYQRTTILSQDLLVRGAPLVKRVSRARATGRWPGNLVGAVQDDGAVVPSMALAAAWMFQRHRQGLSARIEELERTLQEHCVGAPDLVCDLDLPKLGLPPADGDLADVLPINFRAPEHSDPLPTVRAADILRVSGQAALMRQLDPSIQTEIPSAYRDVLQGRVVVVGRAGIGDSGDRFITPFGFPAYLRADMAGCRVQAQVIDTLLSGRHIRVVRGPIWALGAVLVGAVLLTWRRAPDRVHFTGWAAASVGLVIAGAVIFRLTDGWTLDMGPAVAGILGALLGVHLFAWAREAMEAR